MSDDRYAPPSAALGDPRRERGTGVIDLGEAFREAWGAIFENIGVLLAVSLVFFTVAVFASATFVGIFLVLPVLAWGGVRFALNVLDGAGEFSDLFSGFNDYGRVLGTMLSLLILVVLLVLAGLSVLILGMLSGSAFLQSLGNMVNLVWSLTVMSRLTFVWYYAVDQEMGAVDAIQASWTATAEQKMTCALITIVSTIIVTIGGLLFILGAIPALTLVYLLQASAYRQLARR